MGRFEPLVSATPRRSNFVSNAELLRMMELHSLANHGPRKWTFFKGGGGLLFPTPTSAPRYLFRGQIRRHTPCFPSMYRHYKYAAKYLHQLEADDAALIVASFAKTMLFLSEARRHPVWKWANSAHVGLELSEIAQHHGIPTPLIDLSASIEVALFFATHEYDEVNGFTPRIEGRGVLYIVDREGIPKSQQGRFRSAAIQPFARPFKQWAWSCELLMGQCFEACPCLAILEFDHHPALAGAVRERAEAQGSLFPRDILATLASAIRSMTTLPRKAITAAHKHLGPAYPEHVFGPPERLLRNAGFKIWERHEPIFSLPYWEQNSPDLQAALDTWLSETAQNKETILLRHNRAGKPVAIGRFKGPIITPDSIEIIRQLVPIYTGFDHAVCAGRTTSSAQGAIIATHLKLETFRVQRGQR